MTLPLEEKLRIDGQLTHRGYLSFSEYVRDLIRQDLTLVRVKGFEAPICHVNKPPYISRTRSKAAA